MEFASINSPEAAFVAGLITSLHCAGMCGPLACVLMPERAGSSGPHSVSSAYHLARLASYGLLGTIAGGLGRAPLSWISASSLKWLPWLLVAFFVGLALRWDRFLPKGRALSQFAWRWSGLFRRASRVKAAAALGLATPLLPCGPLYFLVALALLSGSALRGAEFMLAFGLGTVPLLWFAQSQFHRLGGVCSPKGLERLRVGIALAAALVVAWRLRGTLGMPGSDPSTLVCF